MKANSADQNRQKGRIAQLRRLYMGGVEAVVDAANETDPDDTRKVCGEWTSAELMTHLVILCDWYEAGLDRALEGKSKPLFPLSELPSRNIEAVANAPQMPLDEAANAFEEKANAYFNRAIDHLDVKYGFPFGTATVGLHLGGAAGEFHLHAWDLDPGHEPDDPAALFWAVAECSAATKNPVSGFIYRRLIPIGLRSHPWNSLIRHSGRDI